MRERRGARVPVPAMGRAAMVLLAGAVLAGCGLFGTDLGVDGVDVRWISVDGQDGREALVVTPEGFDATTGAKLPVVIVMHGLGSNAEDMARLAEWPVAARDRGFMVVFPDGTEDSWNAGGCCGVATEQGVDDVAFLDALIDQLTIEEGGEASQVYMTGYSNGGMMTYRYSCMRPDRLAGAASVAGTDFDEDCDPSGAIPFIQISGSEDPVIPVLGGESSFPGLPEVPSVEQSVNRVRSAAGCAAPSFEDLETVKVFRSEGCRDGAVVRYDVVSGLDHSYPSAGVSPNYVGVDKILEFWGIPTPA